MQKAMDGPHSAGTPGYCCALRTCSLCWDRDTAGAPHGHRLGRLRAEAVAILSPRRLEGLLNDCKSVKVSACYFAARHQHAWAPRLDPAAFDLSSGKRVLVPGGKLDPQFQITVPERSDGEP